MNFNFKISKIGNFFFFVSNLSEWHFSCRREANYYWKRNAPVRSFDEEILLSKYLQKFKKILLKYEKPDNKIVFPILAKSLEAKNYKEIIENFKGKDRLFVKKFFKKFYPIFLYFYQEAEPRFKKFVNIFSKNKKAAKQINKALKLIEIYFGKTDISEVTIYLLIMPPHIWGGGGANIGSKKITLEIGDVSSKAIEHYVLTIIHELTHLCFQYPNSYFDKLLDEFINSLNKAFYQKLFIFHQFNKDIKTVFREGITSSIINGGIIDDLVFKKELKRRLKYDLQSKSLLKASPRIYFRKWIGYNLYSLNQKYLKKKALIDKNYLKQVWQEIKNFERKIKRLL